MLELITGILFLANGVVVEVPGCAEFNNITKKQQRTLVVSQKIGKKHGYEYTLPAIAWVESTAGINTYRKDIRGGSHGAFQNLLENVVQREYKQTLKQNRPVPNWAIKNIKAKLTNNLSYAASHAVKELDYWQARNWGYFMTIAAYNGGYYAKNPKNTRIHKRSHRYSFKVISTAIKLKMCSNSPLI